MVKNISIIYITTLIILVLVYSGLLKTKENYFLYSLLHKEEITEITGTVYSNPQKSGNKYLIPINVKQCTDKKNIKSSAKGIVQVIIPKEYVEAFLPGKLYSNSQKNGGIICEQGFALVVKGAFKQNIFYCKNAKNLNTSGAVTISKIRGILRLQFRRLMFSWGKAGGLFLALISGIKDYADNNLTENFRNSGLSHILALSGMHLNLVNNASKKIFNFIKIKYFSSIMQLVCIVLFVWFSGLTPSLYRALLFSIIGIIVSTLKIKDVKMITILSASFLIHCVTRPWDLHQIAFMLSYGAIAGILILSKGTQMLTENLMPPIISSSFSASLGAQTFTTPITIKMIGTLCPIGILSSMLVSPVITIFIYFGVILLILCLLFPVLVPTGAFLMNILYNIIDKLVSIFSRFPRLSF